MNKRFDIPDSPADELSELAARSPKKSEYSEFYKEQVTLKKLQYPKRTHKEITHLVDLLWKVEKLKKKPQPISGPALIQIDGFCTINGEKVPVPQLPHSLYSRFQQVMKKKLEEKYPHYNGNQINNEIKKAFTDNVPERQEVEAEYQAALNEYTKQKSDFVAKYGSWPKSITPSMSDLKRVKMSSECGNPISQMMLQPVQ